MIYYMHSMSKPYIMSVDVEYDKDKLIQVGAIILKHLGNHLYQVCRSYNTYIKQNDLSAFVQDYTNITQDFIQEYGVELDEAHKLWEEFVSSIHPEDILVVSHGIHQDDIILYNNGFDISRNEHWCTYNMSK